MKKELLALCLIAALPGCGCMRKSTTKSEMPKKENSMDTKGEKMKDGAKKAAKTHMDYEY